MRGLLDLLNLRYRLIRYLVIALIVVALGWVIYILFIANPYTTDAFVQANWVKVAARVAGPVVKIYVKNNQLIKTGQPLFQIDPTTFRIQLHHAEGRLQEIDQELMALEQAIKAQQYVIVSKQATLRYAYMEVVRLTELAKEQAVSVAQMNRAQASYGSAYAEYAQAKYNYERLKAKLGSFVNNGKRKAAQAAVALAKKELSYTTVYATVPGLVSNFYLRDGQYIQIGVPVFSIVENDKFWVQANYLEWELRRIRSGQKASVKVSMYPLHTFYGVVSAIGPGINRGRNISQQNELPNIKETINWLRLFSRFPVFIDIEHVNNKYHLRQGATAAVVVHVK